MNNDIWTTNKLRNINTLFFIGFIFLCYFFGKERAILFDGSRAIYIVSNYKYPFFDENRLPVLINSILPLLVSYFNFTPKYILYAYIISYTLLPISIFLLFRFFAKDEKKLTVFLVSLSLFYFHAFFIASHDTVTIYYYIFFLYFILYNPKKLNKTIQIALTLFTLFLIIFGHLSQVITLFLMIGYLIITKKMKKNTLTLFILIVIMLIIKFLFFKGVRETELLNFKIENYIYPIYQNNTLIGLLKSFFIVNFSYFTILTCTIILLVYYKKYILCAYLVISTTTVILFISYFFGKNMSHGFYTEPHYKGLSVLLSLILVNEIISELKVNKSIVIITATYLFALFNIFIFGLNYKTYYNYISNVCKQIKSNTVYYSNKPIPNCLFSFLPIESAIINTCENNNSNYIAYTSIANIEDIGFIPEQNEKTKSLYKFNNKPIYIKELESLELTLMLKYQNSYFYKDYNKNICK